jgi:uncharacterized protein
MTESSLLNTYPTSNHFPVTAVPSLASPLPNGSLSDTNYPDEEEYTIKCVCIYADDDGNTVYCPRCDTWQHIECYYHGKRVPDEHFCVDCVPRELDAKKATERQRRLREHLDRGERGDPQKTKRPSSKTQKKKHKDVNATSELTNGWHHDRNDSVASTRDGPPAKKPKTSHRTSDSIVSTNGISRKRAVSNLQSYPSPSKSPQDLFRFPQIPTYTTDFLELYERDEGNTNARENEQTIQATNMMFSWRGDSSLVALPGQQPTSKSPFVRAEQPLDPNTWPKVSVETTRKLDVEIDGRSPMWRYLRVHTAVRKNDVVGEVRGQVGMLEEYCQQKSSSNRWQDLRHPDPFVFFHPHMDVYIDSRKTGTQFRFLRRSCQPNVTLKTFVSENDEAHHCFVASKDIPAGSELTTMWYLDQQMFSTDDSEQGSNQRSDWVSRVLANFGDCACNAGSSCLLATFDRRYSGKAIEAAPKDKTARRKKSKKNHVLSPFGTGHATNSRAGSEPKALDDEEQSERRSSPESSGSGGHSRDHTPVNVAALDADPILGSGLTSRELRKIQMIEKTFAQKEQEKKDQNPANQQRKKKRTSGGSTLNTPNANGTKQSGAQSHPNTPNFLANRFQDTSMGSPPPPRGAVGRAKSSDVQSRPHSRPQRPVYIDVCVQTDPDEEEVPIMPPTKRRRFCTPTQRLLQRLREDRAKFMDPCASQVASDGLSPKAPSQTGDEDVRMTDTGHPTPSPAQDATATRQARANSSPLNVGTTTYPLPSQAAHTHHAFKPPSAPKLHLSTLPPVPTFPPSATSASSSSASASTPGMTTTTSALSPTPITSTAAAYQALATPVVTPSPARKKLSLGDYMSRRMASTPTVEKSQSQIGLSPNETDTTKATTEAPDPSASTAEALSIGSRPDEQLAQQVVAQGGLTGSAVEDTPMKDDGEEPEYVPPEVVSTDLVPEAPPPAGEVSFAKSPGQLPVVSNDMMNVVAQLTQIQKTTSH